DRPRRSNAPRRRSAATTCRRDHAPTPSAEELSHPERRDDAQAPASPWPARRGPDRPRHERSVQTSHREQEMSNQASLVGITSRFPLSSPYPSAYGGLGHAPRMRITPANCVGRVGIIDNGPGPSPQPSPRKTGRGGRAPDSLIF